MSVAVDTRPNGRIVDDGGQGRIPEILADQIVAFAGHGGRATGLGYSVFVDAR